MNVSTHDSLFTAALAAASRMTRADQASLIEALQAADPGVRHLVRAARRRRRARAGWRATLLRATGALALGALALTGCATPSAVRASDPVFTRTGPGEPEPVVRCVQERLEDQHGGFFGTMGGVAFETRRDGATVRLLGRSAASPSQARFDLAVTPGTSGEVEAQLRMAAPRWPQESALTGAVDACLGGGR
jgi:hypothetical protein